MSSETQVDAASAASGKLAAVPDPQQSPSPAPSASPAPSVSPSPGPGASAQSSASPSPSVSPAPQGEAATPTFPIVCPGHGRPVVDVRFSRQTSDGVFLVSGCHDKLPMLRWGDNGDWIGSFQGHKGAVWSAALNSDATRAATGSGDFSARVFDAVTGALVHTLEHKHIVKTVDFSPGDSKLLTGGNEKLLRVFRLKGNDVPCSATIRCPAFVRKASWLFREEPAPGADEATDATLVIAGCEDGSMQVWDTSSPEGTLVKSWKVEGCVNDLQFCCAQNTITVAAGKSVHFYDATTFELRKSFTSEFTAVECAALNPATGAHFVLGGSGGDLWVHVFDFETLKEVKSHKGHHGPIFCLRYDPLGLVYASGSEDGTIRLWKMDADDKPDADAKAKTEAKTGGAAAEPAEPAEPVATSS